MKKILIACSVVGLAVIAVLTLYSPRDAEALSIPASSYCVQLGGTETISTGPNQSLDAYCRLPNGTSCNSYDLYRGACPGFPPASSGDMYDLNGRLLKEGDLISASATNDPDIYIIHFRPHGNFAGYKRLFLNPVIFNFYGHLGGFANVHPVSATTRDLFETSGLFRNCETNDQKVWATEVTGEDIGVLHHVQMSGDQALAEDYRFFDRVFCINTNEDNFYARSITPYYRLADVPTYFRRACLTRPACLDATPRCLIPEPVEGWCPSPSPTACAVLGQSGAQCCSGLSPTNYWDTSGRAYGQVCAPPGCHYQDVQCIQAPCNPVLVCPTPTPGTGRSPTVSAVTASWPAGVNTATVTVSGTKPTPCDTVTLTATGNDYSGRIDVTATLNASMYACAQVLTEFSQSVSVTTNPTGTYEVYVNGTRWTTIQR